MDKNLANQIIAEALDLAIKKGCYGILEVTNIVKALEILNTPETNENNK